jgi:hypothetical protein
MGGSSDSGSSFNNPYAQYSQMKGGQPLVNGLPMDISNILAGGGQQLQQQAQDFLPQIQQYLNQAKQGASGATTEGLAQMGGIYGDAQKQLGGMVDRNLSQNQDQLKGILGDYSRDFVGQLGPQGNLGQQLTGEFNNLGITPQSGAFQAGLGNQMATLGSQNALALGQQALADQSQGQAAEYGLLGQGAGAMGGISSAGTRINQGLGTQMGTDPLNLMSGVLGQQQSLTNEATQLPIQNWQSSMGYDAAQNLGNQNVQAQNYGAQMGLLGNLGGAGISAMAK